MSPVITLYVGPERVEFHVHEDKLCQLPFFHAALQGHFVEASEKVIAMPEDDPSQVSAMIEFMYTGNYTYVYESESVLFRQEPSTLIAEGLFHVGMQVMAAKYDYPVLVSSAIKDFEMVVTQLDGIDGLRL